MTVEFLASSRGRHDRHQKFTNRFDHRRQILARWLRHTSPSR